MTLAGIGLWAPTPAAQTGAAPGPLMEGTWRSGDTTMRVVLDRGLLRATMTELGPAARALGFKPGDLSFVAASEGNFLWGQQTIRYGGACHPNGRNVSMMGRMRPDGRVLALHNYTVSIDDSCRDTGEYSIAQTLWERVPTR